MWSYATNYVATSLAAKIQQLFHQKRKTDQTTKSTHSSVGCWHCYIWSDAWGLGKNCSVDKQTCKMQGHNEYKTRCGKFIQLGDRLQCIMDDGYTYNFYFQNKPVPLKWIIKGMCPMFCSLYICLSSSLILVIIAK